MSVERDTAPSRPPAAPATASSAALRVTAEGKVLTREGWPVAGAAVTLLAADGTQTGRAVAGDDGTFRIDGLRPGVATLLVAAPAHDPVARSLAIPAGAVWRLGELRLTRTGAGPTPPPGVYAIDAAHTVVGARAHHLGIASVTGRFTDVAGVITVGEDALRSSVEVQIVAASIDTGNAQRDAHLRSADFLDVANHPTVTFRSDVVLRNGPNWRLPGELTMAGIARPVELDLTYLGSGPDPWGGMRAAFSATTELHRQDFKMNWNQAVGAGIAVFGTTLRVSLDVEAVRQS